MILLRGKFPMEMRLRREALPCVHQSGPRSMLRTLWSLPAAEGGSGTINALASARIIGRPGGGRYSRSFTLVVYQISLFP